MEINLSKFKNDEIFFIGFAVGFIPEWTTLNKFEDNMDCVDVDILVLKKIIRKAQNILQPKRGCDAGIAEFLDDLDDINQAIASKCLLNTDAAIKFLKKYDFDNSVFNFGKRFAEHYPVYLGLRVDLVYWQDTFIKSYAENFIKSYFDEFKIPYVDNEEHPRFISNNLDRGCMSISNILIFTDKIMEILRKPKVRKILLEFALQRKKDGNISFKRPVSIIIDNEEVTSISFLHFVRLVCLCIATERYGGIKAQAQGKKIFTFEKDISLSEVFKSKNAFSELNTIIETLRPYDENISLNTNQKTQDKNYTLYKAVGISVDGKSSLKLYEGMPAKFKKNIPGSPISMLVN